MRKYTMETAVGLFVLVGLICIGYMTVKLGKIPLFGGDTYLLYARFASVDGLRVGSSIEVFGLQVGTVDSLGIDQKKQMGLVGMKINADVKVYDDASATIKTAGLIGDKYIKIDPGGAGDQLKQRSFITQTSVPADIEDLIGKYAFGSVPSSGKEKAPEKPSDGGGK
jgi:phospholipid/cholesterol/gamma-HCH transport system substrate-binding protein